MQGQATAGQLGNGDTGGNVYRKPVAVFPYDAWWLDIAGGEWLASGVKGAATSVAQSGCCCSPHLVQATTTPAACK